MKKLFPRLLIILVLGIFLSGLVSAQASDSGGAGASYTRAEIDAMMASRGESGALTMVWMVLAAALVFFMQAGFAMVETGLTRAKNAANILMKKLMDFAVATVCFFLIGWGLMYGASVSGLFGSSEFFLLGISPDAWASKMKDWFFQMVFAATAATIVSGAVAERIRFKAHLVYTVFISALVYPVVGHWIHGGGWLEAIGFHDFAGSTAVHSVGGWSALAGAMILGPRIGKFVKLNGTTITKAIPGHNLPLASLGVFILWFGWYGFNAGSTLDGNEVMIGHVAVTTTLGAAGGAIGALLLSWIWFRKPDVSMSLNGVLAGLVAITAGCYVVDPIVALLIGFVAGLIVVLSVELIDKVAHVDDPVGAISVHLVNGIWGTLAVGLFALPGRLTINGIPVEGLVYHGNWHTLGVQALGILSVGAWVVGVMSAVFGVLRLVKSLRVGEKEEWQGLDLNEHGADAYHGFQIFSNM